MKSKVVGMNFTGIYGQEFMNQQMDQCLDFQGLSGTDGYCTQEAAEEIRKVIGETDGRIHLLDSGNYHYLSKFWTEQVKEPYQLVVFDHHTDMQPSALLPLTSCGNWLLETIQEQENLVHVWMVGPPRDSIDAVDPEWLSKVTCISQEELRQGIEVKFDLQKNLPVYISIDKDILSQEALSTNWDQGDLNFQELMDLLHEMDRTIILAGCDLCGEPDVKCQPSWEVLAQAKKINDTLIQFMKTWILEGET